jgi:hypothetical protein
MPNDPVMRPTSDDEAKEQSPSEDTRAAWERPALRRLAAIDAEGGPGDRLRDGEHHHS